MAVGVAEQGGVQNGRGAAGRGATRAAPQCGAFLKGAGGGGKVGGKWAGGGGKLVGGGKGGWVGE